MLPKPIPPEVADIAEVVRRECRSYEDLLFKVQVIRTRPYSRLAAIVYASVGFPTLREVCMGMAPPEVVSYVRRIGACRPVVKIYRGTPTGDVIRAGDWVALERSYAAGYGIVTEKTVTWDDVVWAGTYEKEWYYVPKRLRGYFKDLREFWESVVSAGRGVLPSITIMWPYSTTYMHGIKIYRRLHLGNGWFLDVLDTGVVVRHYSMMGEFKAFISYGDPYWMNKVSLLPSPIREEVASIIRSVRIVKALGLMRA